MNEKIYELLSEKINEVFFEMQNDLGITSGDITPFDLLQLEELTCELSNHIENVLKSQK